MKLELKMEVRITYLMVSEERVNFIVAIFCYYIIRPTVIMTPLLLKQRIIQMKIPKSLAAT